MEHGEAQESGDLCSDSVTEVGEVDGDGIDVGLLKMTEAERYFRAVDLFDGSTEAADAGAEARFDSSDLAASADVEDVVERPGVEDEQSWRRLIDVGRVCMGYRNSLMTQRLLETRGIERPDYTRRPDAICSGGSREIV